MELRTIQFTAPSKHIYEIREQNGEDEDILSNPLEMRTLMHLSRYISAIVIKTTFTNSGKLTVEDALNLPLLDRYCILIKARIFSIGPELNFDYSWGKSVIQYEEDLNKYVFDKPTIITSINAFVFNSKRSRNIIVVNFFTSIFI